MATDMTIAKTILEQLGGNKFIAMTGAKGFTASDRALTFRLPGAGGFCKDGINAVRVTLNQYDTYDVEFMRIRGTKVTPVHTDNGIYNDQFEAVFAAATGLCIRGFER